MEDIKIIKGFLTEEEAKTGYEYLTDPNCNIEWNNILNVVGSKEKVKINRKMAYVTDIEVDYTYAKLWFKGTTWNPILKLFKGKIEDLIGVKFNSVLLNWYKDGKDEIKWHSDKEESLGDKPVIACINLGATRKFWFRKIVKDNPKFFYEVENGDLLIMEENCQKNYVHAILKEPEVKESRISLTYRFNDPIIIK